MDTNDAEAGYLGTDVMYIDDHGGTTASNSNNAWPAVPLGSGTNKVCTPFILGYTFDAWKGPFSKLGSKQSYMIFQPDNVDNNYGVSISGIQGRQVSYI